MKSSNAISKFVFLLIAALAFSITSMDAQGMTVNARAYLQGALTNSFGTGTTHDRPLMRDDLRNNPFTDTRVIPDDDIYQTPLVLNEYVTIDITGNFTHVACGTYAQYRSIAEPIGVFSVMGEDAIVDWIFLELRDKNDYTNVVATRSALVQRDGDIVDLDGTSAVFFPDVPTDSYFLVVRHRNHLGVMTKYPKTPEELSTLIDFTDMDAEVFDFANTISEFNYSGMALATMDVEGTEYKALWAGDCNSDGRVVFRGDKNDLTVIHEEVAGFDLTLNPDYKLDFQLSIGYLQGDIDMDGKTKFVSPNDDTNQLVVQVVLYAINSKNIANFAHLVEQLP
ncbi:MAG: hypothetical protein AAGA77_18605 [Bacteroidota bacterium]